MPDPGDLDRDLDLDLDLDLDTRNKQQINEDEEANLQHSFTEPNEADKELINWTPFLEGLQNPDIAEASKTLTALGRLAKRRIPLESAPPHLIDVLLCQGGVFHSCQARSVSEETLEKCGHPIHQNFWVATVEPPVIRNFLCICISTLFHLMVGFNKELEAHRLIQLFPLSEVDIRLSLSLVKSLRAQGIGKVPALNESQSKLDLGMEALGENVRKVALLLLEFCQRTENACILVSNEAFLRFQAILLHCSWKDLRQIGQELLLVVSPFLKLDHAEIRSNPTAAVIFAYLQEGLESTQLNLIITDNSTPLSNSSNNHPILNTLDNETTKGANQPVKIKLRRRVSKDNVLSELDDDLGLLVCCQKFLEKGERNQSNRVDDTETTIQVTDTSIVTEPKLKAVKQQDLSEMEKEAEFLTRYLKNFYERGIETRSELNEMYRAYKNARLYLGEPFILLCRCEFFNSLVRIFGISCFSTEKRLIGLDQKEFIFISGLKLRKNKTKLKPMCVKNPQTNDCRRAKAFKIMGIYGSCKALKKAQSAQ